MHVQHAAASAGAGACARGARGPTICTGGSSGERTGPLSCNALEELDFDRIPEGVASWRDEEDARRRVAVDWTEDRVTMRLRLHPQPAYPFALDLGVQYVINAGGLAVTLTATNVGDGPAPFGAGFHPYLTAGTALVDDAVLTVPAEAWMPADDAGIPTGERRPVDGDLDLRAGRAIGGSVLDHCFTGLDRDADGRAAVSLDGPAGRLRLWMDGAFGFVMVFTGDTLPPERRRRGVAVEPMSCAADAFNSGAGLVALHPGGQFVGSWGIAVDPAA